MEYQVQQIIDRKVYSGKVLYLVKWKGFPREESSWESIKVLKKVKHFVKEYNNRHKNTQFHLDQGKETKPVIRGKRGRPRKNNIVKQRENIKIPWPQHHSQQFFFDNDDDEKKSNSKISNSKQQEKDTNANNQDQIETKSKVTQADAKSQHPFHEIKHGLISIMNSQKHALSTPFSQSQSQEKIETSFEKPMTKLAKMTKTAQSQLTLKKIYFIEKTEDEKIQYLVEYSNGNLVKCFSDELVQKYPSQLIKFLEESLISKAK